MKLTIPDLYDLDHTLAGDYLRQFTYPWEALAGIGDMISALGAALSPDEYDHPEEGVWVARDAKVYPTAYLGQSKKLSEHLSLHTKRQFPLVHGICGRRGIAYQCCHS